MFRFRKLLLACALAFPASYTAFAATTVTGTFNVTMSITAQCAVSNPTTLAFGSSGLIAAAINQTNTFSVTCSNTTPYTVGLDTGANAQSGQRRMKGGATNSEFISYNLYQDSARATPWGNASGSWESGIGNGSLQSFTVYGQVPPQATPSPATNYTDTVTINVTY